eukprot:823397-Ditylum_brightwellii.AAC.1
MPHNIALLIHSGKEDRSSKEQGVLSDGSIHEVCMSPFMSPFALGGEKLFQVGWLSCSGDIHQTMP